MSVTIATTNSLEFHTVAQARAWLDQRGWFESRRGEFTDGRGACATLIAKRSAANDCNVAVVLFDGEPPT